MESSHQACYRHRVRYAVTLVNAALAGMADYLIRHKGPRHGLESCCGTGTSEGFTLKHAVGVRSVLTPDGRIWEHRVGRTPG